MKSQYFCVTTFSASLTDVPDKYRLQMTKWVRVILIAATVLTTESL